MRKTVTLADGNGIGKLAICGTCNDLAMMGQNLNI